METIKLQKGYAIFENDCFTFFRDMSTHNRTITHKFILNRTEILRLFKSLDLEQLEKNENEKEPDVLPF